MRILAHPAFKNRRENPYNASLCTALAAIPGVTVAEFTNRRVLLERWDIVHVHWPDTPLQRRSTPSAILYTCVLLARLFWARLLGAKIVWTVHNLLSHGKTRPRIEKWLWKSFIPLVDSCIHLSNAGRDMALKSFPALASKSNAVVPHGHYRDAYPNNGDRAEARALLGMPANAPVITFVGQIKAYKNVSTLIRCFIEAAHPSALLLIAGRPGDSTIEADLRTAARRQPRVITHFGLIPDDRMQLYLNACDLAVFPYRDILNSGSAILALSFNRPALVPARGAMAELQQLSGPGWIYTYEGDLTGPILSTALDQSLAASRPPVCDLSALSWQSVAAGTHAAYCTATGRGTPSAIPEPALA